MSSNRKNEREEKVLYKIRIYSDSRDTIRFFDEFRLGYSTNNVAATTMVELFMQLKED